MKRLARAGKGTDGAICKELQAADVRGKHAAEQLAAAAMYFTKCVSDAKDIRRNSFVNLDGGSVQTGHSPGGDTFDAGFACNGIVRSGNVGVVGTGVDEDVSLLSRSCADEFVDDFLG